MKKIICLVSIFLIIFSLSACSKKEPAVAENIYDNVAICLDEIDGFETLDNETQKALSVIIRTKQKNSDVLPAPKKASDQACKVSKTTSGEILEDLNFDPKNLKIVNNFTPKTYQKNLSKSDLLKCLSKLNISLPSIKNISPEFEEKIAVKDNQKNTTNSAKNETQNNSPDYEKNVTKKLKSLTIGGKVLSAEKIYEALDVKNAVITDFKTSSKGITIFFTETKSECYFDITESVLLSKQGYDYHQLLNHFYSKNA